MVEWLRVMIRTVGIYADPFEASRGGLRIDLTVHLIYAAQTPKGLAQVLQHELEAASLAQVPTSIAF
jgi:hypothetical protein